MGDDWLEITFTPLLDTSAGHVTNQAMCASFVPIHLRLHEVFSFIRPRPHQCLHLTGPNWVSRNFSDGSDI